ncbi:MAG: hypothetical protein AUG51_03585 [Acidobacteria bacterium 13_1_20CM_3_53_8]|nr:MAG: hypothetical protein AUG51_03585 [Acidobacteria bacterium 13_1_20CM_3_53_8]
MARIHRVPAVLATFFVLLAMSIASAPPSYAQGGATATIVGTVVDPNGAVVPDADVVARNVGTGIERSTKTSSDGLYRLDNLPPGVYDITVTKQGFSSAQAKAVKLQVGEQRDVNFPLVVQGATGQVTVTSELPLVETTKTDVSTVITDAQVSTLPTTTSLNGIGGVANDYAGLAVTAPGVRYDTTSVSSDLLGPGAVNDRGIQVNVNGGNISDQVVSTRDALGASVEEVQEFQVLTNNYNAEFGQAGGIILNVITKSGTNAFHGDAHYYTRGRNLAASNFFYNLSPDARFRRAPFHKYEGGGTAGGPLIRNRTFWFVSYEQVRQAVPLILTPPGGTINTTQPTRELLYSGRIDHQFTKSNFLTARYNVQRDLNDNLLVQIPPIVTPESLVSGVVHDNTLNISDTWTATPTLVNEFRFFWHRFLTQTPTKSENPGLQGPNFYHGAAFCCPQGGLQKRFQFIDNLSWTHGAHTFKGGANISHFPYFSLFTQINRGLYLFDNPEPNPGAPSEFDIGIGPAQVTTTDNIYGFYFQDSWKVRPNVTLNLGIRYDVEQGAFRGGTIRNGSGCFQGNGIIPACSSDRNNFQPRIGIAWSPRFKSGFMHSLFGDSDRTVIRLSFAEITMLAYLNVSLDSLNFDGVNLLTVAADASTPLGQAILAFSPNRPPDTLLEQLRPAGFFGRVRPISPNLKNPETRNINFTISRQVGNHAVIDLGYLGVFGRGLFGERDQNFPVIKADPAHPGFFYLAPRPDPRFTAVRTNENTRRSNYHGGYISFTQRLSHHVQGQASYTYSKTLTSTEDFFGLSEPADPRDVDAEYALASNDVRHQVNFGMVFDIENFTHHSFAKYIFNNWSIGIIGRFESGRPYPVSTGDGPFSGSTFFGAGNETVQRPNVLPDGTLSTTNIAGRGGNLLISQAGHVVCPACPQTTFIAPAGASRSGPRDSLTGDPVDFQFLNGNLQRNAGHTDPFTRFDMSFIKAFPIREQMRFEVKIDIFNILNHTNFILFNGNPNLNAMPISTDPNCRSCLNAITGHYVGSNGEILTIQDLRHGRVDSDITNPTFGGLGNPTGTDLSRTIQVSARFKW